MRSIRTRGWMMVAAWCVIVGWGQPAAADKPAAPVPLMKDLGNLHHPITTPSKHTQRYFDQGLRLAYAFNHEEAHKSFQEAARLDPQCAMCYWGMALVLGPNINMPMDAAAEAPAHDAAQEAVSLAAKASRAEQVYIRSSRIASAYALSSAARLPPGPAYRAANGETIQEGSVKSRRDVDGLAFLTANRSRGTG